jgi:hypothetical protein
MKRTLTLMLLTLFATTVHELLAHYRTLLLPDVPIDDWDLDATIRKPIEMLHDEDLAESLHFPYFNI